MLRKQYASINTFHIPSKNLRDYVLYVGKNIPLNFDIGLKFILYAVFGRCQKKNISPLGAMLCNVSQLKEWGKRVS